MDFLFRRRGWPLLELESVREKRGTRTRVQAAEVALFVLRKSGCSSRWFFFRGVRLIWSSAELNPHGEFQEPFRCCQ